MTTYNGSAVGDAAFGFQKPATLQQGRALRDNPIAMAEGATNAPYVWGVWHPYDSALVGDANDGEIYDFADDGAVANVVTPDFSDGFEYRLKCEGLASGSTTQFQIELYFATAAAYSAAGQLLSYPPGSATHIDMVIDIFRPRDIAKGFVVQASGKDVVTTSVSAAAAVSLSFANTTAQKITRARVSFDSANITGGKIRMYRRRVF